MLQTETVRPVNATASHFLFKPPTTNSYQRSLQVGWLVE